ncbi:MAG: STAS domain-containing protein [Pseudonocardia sp.]
MAQAATEEPIRIQLEEPASDTALLRVSGEIDMLTSPILRQGIAEQLSDDRMRLLVDLNGVDFLGTSGLAALVEARSSAAEHAIELWLVCTNRQVLRPLEIAGLTSLFRIAGTVAEALGGQGSTQA